MLQPKWLRKNVESWEEKEEQIIHFNTKMRLIRLNTHSFHRKRCGATWSIFFKYASKEYNNAKITRMSDHFCNAGDSNLALINFCDPIFITHVRILSTQTFPVAGLWKLIYTNFQSRIDHVMAHLLLDAWSFVDHHHQKLKWATYHVVGACTIGKVVIRRFWYGKWAVTPAVEHLGV